MISVKMLMLAVAVALATDEFTSDQCPNIVAITSRTTTTTTTTTTSEPSDNSTYQPPVEVERPCKCSLLHMEIYCRGIIKVPKITDVREVNYVNHINIIIYILVIYK